MYIFRSVYVTTRLWTAVVSSLPDRHRVASGWTLDSRLQHTIIQTLVSTRDGLYHTIKELTKPANTTSVLAKPQYVLASTQVQSALLQCGKVLPWQSYILGNIVWQNICFCCKLVVLLLIIQVAFLEPLMLACKLYSGLRIFLFWLLAKNFLGKSGSERP